MKKASAAKPVIVQDGDPVLRGKAKPVPKSDFGGTELKHIIRAMQTALQAESDGVAIAAPQIGVPLRIFVVSQYAFTLASEEKSRKEKSPLKIPNKDMVCINPELIKLSKKKVTVPEGCLSVRWKYGDTLRHEKATIRAYDEHGKLFTYGGSGLIAQIFQHETDHLNGILFVDHATNVGELEPEQIAEIQSKNKSAHGS